MNYDAIAVWSQVISALLFLVVLVWGWFKYIQPAVLAAQERQNARLAESERHRDEARAALDVLRAEIDGATRDAGLIRQRAIEQGAGEKEAIVAAAREAGERSLRGAHGELARAREAARDQLRVEMLDRALQSAREKAALRVDASMNAELVGRFVSALEAEGRNHG